MFGVSVIYLILYIIFVITKKINFEFLNLFNPDGLSIIGCIFAVGELLFSKRNLMSKKINEFFIKKKYVNFRIDISTKCENKNNIIKELVDKFEEVLNNNLSLDNLDKKPQNKLTEYNHTVRYENIGLEVQYIKENNNLSMILKGKSQYGKISSKENDILYLTLLVKILSNKFLQDRNIRKLIDVKKIDIIINQEGSQFNINNLFNEDLTEVEEYNLKIMKGLEVNGEVEINKYQLRLTVLNIAELFNGFTDFTNIICNIN